MPMRIDIEDYPDGGARITAHGGGRYWARYRVTDTGRMIRTDSGPEADKKRPSFPGFLTQANSQVAKAWAKHSGAEG